MWKVPLFDLNYNDEETAVVTNVLHSKWLSAGARVEEFERSFEAYLGEDVLCTAVANCTAALHLSLLLNGIKQDDEVIISGLSFIASLNVVSIMGAKAVLADCKSLDDWNVSAQDIESKITQNTKAVIIVHYAGYPCDMDEISKLCKDRNLILVEDAAHAPGASYKGRKCGTFGDLACLSFFSNKNLSTGEGGMIITKSAELHRQARLLRSHGMTSMTIDRDRGNAISYDVVKPGLNYRMDEIRAALGTVQLNKLDAANNARKLMSQKYISCLSSRQDIVIPWGNYKGDSIPSYHIFPIMLPEGIDRSKVMEYMKGKGIQTSIHYPAYAGFSHYGDKIKGATPIADEISARVLTLPLYPTLTEAKVEDVCATLNEVL